MIGYSTAKGFYCLECYRKKKYVERLEILKTFSIIVTDDNPFICEMVQVCEDCDKEFSTRRRMVSR